MYRSKDFLLMEVFDVKGKKLGTINDILINFSMGCIEGFSICSKSFFNKNVVVKKEDIIYFNETMIVKKSLREDGLKFFKLKGMEIIDTKGNNIGIMEDIIFDSNSFRIYGLIVSKGFISNFVHGKKILLINCLILGENNILYYGDENKIKFTTMPHNITGIIK